MTDFDDEHNIEKTAIISESDFQLLQQNVAQDAYMITISGRNVGKMYKLDEGQTFLGRSPDCAITLDDDGISRMHAMIENIKNKHYQLNDNGSTNGVFVNGAKIRSCVLEAGDKVQLGSNTILKFSYQDEVEEQYQQKMLDAATKDALTGAYNKRYFVDHLKTEFSFSFRHNTPLSLILFDIDFFKKLNDGWGHLAGDQVLKELSEAIMTMLRQEDIFARYGGEEFGIILRDTNEEKAFLTAERVRRTVENFEFIYDNDRLPVTISLGVATLKGGNFKSPKYIVRSADEYLYKAKNNGRNRIESHYMES